MTDPATGIALKVGLQVISRVTPSGLAWIRSRWVGRDILVVGQPRAGKTSLVRYIQHGFFAEEDTPRTREIKKTAAFTVTMGRDRSLALEVRKAIDTVGQVSAVEHARLSEMFKPHVLIAVLDMNGPWDGSEERSARFYLSEFLENFGDIYKFNRGVRRKLRTIVVVLNKRDRVDEKKAAAWLKKATTLVHEKLLPIMGAQARAIQITETSLIEDYDKGRAINAIIKNIALKLSES